MNLSVVLTAKFVHPLFNWWKLGLSHKGREKSNKNFQQKRQKKGQKLVKKTVFKLNMGSLSVYTRLYMGYLLSSL